MNRDRRRTILIWVVTVFVGSPLFVQARTQAPKPNVLFIIVDDLRPQLGCYRYQETLSPHIDHLAREGVLFKRAYCQIPICGASRASIFTGIRPTATRFGKYNSRADKETPKAVTLPALFKSRGYTTVSNGKVFHIRADSDTASWSESAWLPALGRLAFMDPESETMIGGTNRRRGPFCEAPDVADDMNFDGMVCEKTIADLKRLSKQDKPFFIACGFYRPHLPFYVPKRYWDRYDRDDIVLATNLFLPKDLPSSVRASKDFHFYHDRNVPYNSEAFHKLARHGYYASVTYIDALVGRIMNSLTELELMDNTIIVLVGDHGWHLGEHTLWSKHNLLHNAIHSPFIMKLPGHRGQVQMNQLVEFVDIYPTLCQLAGIGMPGRMANQLEGSSLVPLFETPQRPWKQAVFSRFQNGDTVVTERYVYTKYMKTDGSLEQMLYDHQQDPQENINVATHAEYRSVLKKMQGLLTAGWRAQSVQ